MRRVKFILACIICCVLLAQARATVEFGCNNANSASASICENIGWCRGGMLLDCQKLPTAVNCPNGQDTVEYFKLQSMSGYGACKSYETPNQCFWCNQALCAWSKGYIPSAHFGNCAYEKCNVYHYVANACLD